MWWLRYFAKYRKYTLMHLSSYGCRRESFSSHIWGNIVFQNCFLANEKTFAGNVQKKKTKETSEIFYATEEQSLLLQEMLRARANGVNNVFSLVGPFFLIYQTSWCTSMFSIFSSRSLKEESCSMEIFFSAIMSVCTSGMLIPRSFLLFDICKYTDRFKWLYISQGSKTENGSISKKNVLEKMT